MYSIFSYFICKMYIDIYFVLYYKKEIRINEHKTKKKEEEEKDQIGEFVVFLREGNVRLSFILIRSTKKHRKEYTNF